MPPGIVSDIRNGKKSSPGRLRFVYYVVLSVYVPRLCIINVVVVYLTIGKYDSGVYVHGLRPVSDVAETKFFFLKVSTLKTHSIKKKNF